MTPPATTEAATAAAAAATCNDGSSFCLRTLEYGCRMNDQNKVVVEVEEREEREKRPASQKEKRRKQLTPLVSKSADAKGMEQERAENTDIFGRKLK